MKRISVAFGMAALVSVIVTGCGGGNQQPTGGQSIEVTLTSAPDPPKMGENTFEVMVMAGSQPVTDAEVSVQLYMAAMPAMNMAEMKNTVPLKHESGARYRGTGNVMMAGAWDATVMVMRGGKEIATRKLTVTAK